MIFKLNFEFSFLKIVFQDDEKYLSERNLTQLILPLCTTYLLNPDYVKHSQLVEQAIVLFGAICKTLPWAQYEIYIKYYTGLFNKVKKQNGGNH